MLLVDIVSELANNHKKMIDSFSLLAKDVVTVMDASNKMHIFERQNIQVLAEELARLQGVNVNQVTNVVKDVVDINVQ